MQSVFDQHSKYWLKKSNIPSSMEPELAPYLNKGLKVLDLGCGGGRLAKSLLPYFQSVSGLDGSQELVTQASQENPNISFICGNFQSPSAWKNLGVFDMIISNCALRKDYCGDPANVFSLCKQHLKSVLILRIQGVNDLSTVLPLELRNNLFYNEQEIYQALKGFDVKIKHENYHQKFSNESYFRKFLERINIPFKGAVKDLNPIRQYYIVKAIIDEKF